MSFEMRPFDSQSVVRSLIGSPGIAVVEEFLHWQLCAELVELALLYERDKFGTVRGLLDKSAVFERILLQEDVVDLCRVLLGAQYRLGSLDIKIATPAHEGSGVMELKPHIDYPGGNGIGHREGPDSRYFGLPLALKMFIPLTDLSLDSGATAYIPNSHLWHRDPGKHPLEFERRMATGGVSRLIVPKGSVAFWAGPLWHADLQNQSATPRFLFHICFTPSYAVRPHSLDRLYSRSFVEASAPKLRALIQ